MDLKEKVEEAFKKHIGLERIQLNDDDGVFGFVISAGFRGMSAIDRQALIYNALHDPASKLTKPELRQVLAIAALTPAEFEVRGPGRERSRRCGPFVAETHAFVLLGERYSARVFLG
jgi:acid stress-induced BolA-like protein IbaG/YrbA